jgi:hypothetical protein
VRVNRPKPKSFDSWNGAAVVYYTHGIMRQIQEIEKWDKENGY